MLQTDKWRLHISQNFQANRANPNSNPVVDAKHCKGPALLDRLYVEGVLGLGFWVWGLVPI